MTRDTDRTRVNTPRPMPRAKCGQCVSAPAIKYPSGSAAP